MIRQDTTMRKSINYTGSLRLAPIGLGDAQERIFEHFRNLPVTTAKVNDTIITFGGQDAGKSLWKRSSKETAMTRLGVSEAEFDGFVCPDCGNKTVNICHIVPKSFGGNRTPQNLEIDCEKCNKDESNAIWYADVDEWALSYVLSITITYEVK